MNDKKYESLRKKLDKLGFTQTLNPDSVQLVDKLYNQLFKYMTELDQERKKKQQIQAHSSSDSILYDRVDSLTLERDSLRKQLQELRSSNSQKENDDKIRNLNMLVNSFKIKQEQSNLEYERQVKKLSSQLACMEAKYGQLQKENKYLRSMNADKSNQSDKYTQELSGLIEKKGKQIRQLEESNSKLRIKVQILQKNLEEHKNGQRQSKQEEKSQMQKINNLLKMQLAQFQNKNRMLKNQLENQRDETEKLKRDLRRFKEQVAALKKEDLNTKNLDNLGRVTKQKIQILYQQSRQMVAEKTEELKSLREQFQDSEKEKGRLQTKVKELMTKNKHLLDQNADLQTQIEHISAKSTINIKRVRELEAMVASLEKQIKDNISMNENSGKESMQGLIKEQQQRYEHLRKESVIKDRQLKIFEQEFKVLKEQAQMRALQRDRALAQLKKMQMIASEGSRHLQTLQLQKEQLMKQNRQLRTGKQLMTSADSVAKSEIFLMRQKIQSLQAQNDEIHAMLKAQQLRSKQFENQMAKTLTVLNKSEEKNRQVFQDNRLMASQIKILQERKNELHGKVKQLQQKSHLQMEGDSYYRKQLDQSNTKNQEILTQLARKDQAIRRLDAQKDQLQNELDQQTEQKSRLKQQLILLEKDIRQQTRIIEEYQRSINQLQRKISRSQSGREDIQSQYQRMVQQEVGMRDRLISYEAQLRELKNQASLLVISHQQAQKQVERSRNKIAEMDRKMKDKIRQNEQQRERGTALNILCSELQAELERQRAESVRIKGFVSQLQQANNHMYQQLQRKDQELNQFGRQLEQKERTEEQYIHEINSYQRQLQNLALDLENAQAEVQRLSGQRQSLRAERNWKKEVSSLTQDWRTKQQQRYLGVQQDLNKFKVENQRLKNRCQQLQDIASNQRLKNCRLSQQLGTPGRVQLVESRVQSYNENQNVNNSNVYVRSRDRSLHYLGDNLSQQSESESVKSAKQSLMQIERKYMQGLPNLRSN